MVWYSHLFKNFPQFVVICTVKGFSIVNEAEVDVFLEFPCFFYDPVDVGNLIFGCSAFSESIFLMLACEMNTIVLYDSLNTLWHCPSLGLE